MSISFFVVKRNTCTGCVRTNRRTFCFLLFLRRYDFARRYWGLFLSTRLLSESSRFVGYRILEISYGRPGKGYSVFRSYNFHDVVHGMGTRPCSVYRNDIYWSRVRRKLVTEITFYYYYYYRNDFCYYYEAIGLFNYFNFEII